MGLKCLFPLSFGNQWEGWVLCEAESLPEVLHHLQSTKPPLKVLGCFLWMTLTLPFRGLEMFLWIILAVGGESVQWSWSGEQSKWKTEENCGEGNFILWGLLRGLKRSLLGMFLWGFFRSGWLRCWLLLWRLCWGPLWCDLWWWHEFLWGCFVVCKVFWPWFPPLSLCLFRFVEVSISSGCSLSVFLLPFFLIFLQVIEVVMEVWYKNRAGVAGSVCIATATVLVMVSVDFAVASAAASVVLRIRVFSPFWSVTWVHPSSSLFGWSPGSRSGLVVRLLVFSELLLMLLPSVGRLLIDDITAYKTSKEATCYPRSLSSAGPYWSIYVGWPEALPVETGIQDEVTVCCPICQAHLCHLLNAAICAHIGSEDVSI